MLWSVETSWLMNVLRIGIIEYCRTHPDATFSPSEVVKKMYPQSWEYFLNDIWIEALDMYERGEIQLTREGKPFEKGDFSRDEVMISKLKQVKSS